MAKVKYNVKGVERGNRDFKQPKPGLYEMEIMEANLRQEDGKNDIELVLEVTKNNKGSEEEFVGSRVWTYVGLGEASQWKMGELVDALGLPEEGSIDTEKLKGKKMKVKINQDSYNNEYRARAGRFSPLEAAAEDADAADDPDATDDPDTTVEFITIDRNDVELSNDPSYYDDWSTDDLKEEVENQGLEISGRFSKQKVIDALVELVNDEAGGGGGGGDEAGAAASDDGDEYDDEDVWSDKDLAAEYKKRGLDTIEGKKNREKVIAALRADDAGDEDDPFAD